MNELREMFERRFKNITEDEDLNLPRVVSLNALKPIFFTFFKLGVYFGQQEKEETKINLGEPTDELKNTIEELK